MLERLNFRTCLFLLQKNNLFSHNHDPGVIFNKHLYIATEELLRGLYIMFNPDKKTKRFQLVLKALQETLEPEIIFYNGADRSPVSSRAMFYYIVIV